MPISDTLNRNHFGLADPIPKIPGATRLESGRSSLRSMPCSERKNCQRELGLADVVADVWPWGGPGWPSQPLIARRAIKGSPNRKLRVRPFATENPTTCLRGNPTVETRSQPAPMRLSNAYFSILLSRHSYRKFNNIRVPGVAHNPKVVGSNPTPATKELIDIQRLRR